MTVLTYVAIAASMFGGPKVPKEHAASFKEIKQSYERMAKAYGEQDTTTILGFRDSTCFVSLPDGTTSDYEMMRGDLRRFFAMNLTPIKVKYVLKDPKFPAPDSAIVTCTQEASRYQELAGKKREVKHDATQDEIWVKRAGGWRLRAIGNIRNRHRWVDGKAVDPAKPYDPNAPKYEPEENPATS